MATVLRIKTIDTCDRCRQQATCQVITDGEDGSHQKYGHFCDKHGKVVANQISNQEMLRDIRNRHEVHSGLNRTT